MTICDSDSDDSRDHKDRLFWSESIIKQLFHPVQNSEVMKLKCVIKKSFTRMMIHLMLPMSSVPRELILQFQNPNHHDVASGN